MCQLVLPGAHTGWCFAGGNCSQCLSTDGGKRLSPSDSLRTDVPHLCTPLPFGWSLSCAKWDLRYLPVAQASTRSTLVLGWGFHLSPTLSACGRGLCSMPSPEVQTIATSGCCLSTGHPPSAGGSAGGRGDRPPRAVASQGHFFSNTFWGAALFRAKNHMQQTLPDTPQLNVVLKRVSPPRRQPPRRKNGLLITRNGQI